MTEHAGLAGIGEDNELVRQVAADRPGIRLHRDRLQAHALVCPEIGHEHLPVSLHGTVIIQIEGVVVLHQELTATHDPESRPDLVPEFPLDVVKHFRQVAIALHRGAEDLRDQFLVGRTVQHLAAVPVLDAQHFLAVIVVAARLPPQVGCLNGRHQDLLGTRPVLLLADDLFDLSENAKTDRQPRINPGARLTNHPGAQHETMGDNLRLRWRVLRGRQKISGKAHYSRLKVGTGGNSGRRLGKGPELVHCGKVVPPMPVPRPEPLAGSLSPGASPERARPFSLGITSGRRRLTKFER